MLYHDHWDELKNRMMGYWERAAMDRCCAAITVKNPDYDLDSKARQFYFDAEGADKMHRERFAN